MKKTSNINIYQEKNSVVTKFFGTLYDKVQDKIAKEHPISSKRTGSTALVGIHFMDKKIIKIVDVKCWGFKSSIM